LIGVTTSEVRRSERAHPLREADPAQQEMVLGLVYAQAVHRAGGMPVVLPPFPARDVPELVARLDALVLSGGPDLDPTAYHARADEHLGPLEPELDVFELAMARQADAVGLPVLGVCRGCQVLNVARGGTLHQHLPDVTDGRIDHRQSIPGCNPTHAAEVTPRSRLASVVGAGTADVNSFHHQAADRVGDGLVAVAWSPDGVVEALEDPDAPFVLGVQWHAETLVDRPEHLRIFEALVQAAGARDVREAA
jgi:putative glutamine amidotransferase